MDLTEAEVIKKRWQEYTEELYKKDHHDPDNHDGVITHLEPDILEWDILAQGPLPFPKPATASQILFAFSTPLLPPSSGLRPLVVTFNPPDNDL